MNGILENPMVKKLISFFNLIYLMVLFLLAYSTFLYDLQINKGAEIMFFTVYVIANFIFLGFLFFTRKEIVSKVISFLLLPIVLFILVFNMGNWILIIPPFVVAVVSFFITDINETVKVIFGTINLLVYVLAIVVLFIFSNINTSVETRLDESLDTSSDVYRLYDMNTILEQVDKSNSVSPNGELRFYLYDVQDNNKGELKLIVEPYGQDKVMKFFTLRQKGIRRVVYRFEGRGEIPEIVWKDNQTVQYKLSGDEEYSESYVTLPDKDYFVFLGLD
ncbi:MAG: hypothetical protein GX896_02025 [Clostridiales bacterium]|nr:hypothetical protein [Clostridiales bacterium]